MIVWRLWLAAATVAFLCVLPVLGEAPINYAMPAPVVETHHWKITNWLLGTYHQMQFRWYGLMVNKNNAK